MKKYRKSKLTNLFGIALSAILLSGIFAAAQTVAAQPILFQTNRDGNNEIYKMNVDGSNQQRLTNSTEIEAMALWSPDGTKILFRKGLGSTQQIWTMDADGSNKLLVSDAGGVHTPFAWSRDGQKIFYTKVTTGTHTRIWVMNADGSNKTLLTDSPSFDHFPSLSPDGSKIAFGRCDSTTFVCDIYTMNADGSNLVNLTPTSGNDDDLPLWADNGSKIVFAAENGTNYNVYSINADGTNRQQLTNAPSQMFATPAAISPDGNKIGLSYGTTATSAGYEVATVNLDGSNFFNLTNNAFRDAFEKWSPNGAKIAFNSTRDQTAGEIYTMNADGTGVVRLTNNTATDTVTDWFRPRKRAVYDFDGDGRTDISVTRSEGNSQFWYIQRSSDSGVNVINWGFPSDNFVPADYDGDGKTDIAIWRVDGEANAQGYYYILQSSTNSLRIIPWGVSFDDARTVGDFDGDGKADPCVIRTAQNGQFVWYVRRSTDNQYQVTLWGNNTLDDIPIEGDYDGDGKDDVAIYRISTNTYYVLQSSNGQSLVRQWGNFTTDWLVPGDYDGDGRDDFAVWRGGPSGGTQEGIWYILQSSNGQMLARQWGGGPQGTDFPAPGDYDGDGKTDFAVVRETEDVSVWWVLQSSSNSFFALPFGRESLDDDYIPALRTR